MPLWSSGHQEALAEHCEGSRRRATAAESEWDDMCALDDIRSSRGAEPACSSCILVHAGVGELPEQNLRNRSVEGRESTISRRMPWAAWHLAVVTMAACASASGSLVGVEGCQPAFTDPTPALATLRGASGSRAGPAIANPALGSQFSTTARSIEPAVRTPMSSYPRNRFSSQRHAPLPLGTRLTLRPGCR